MKASGQRDEFLPTSRGLLSRLKDSGDQKSWQDFFNTYSKLIYGVAIKTGLTDAEAQDVLQETVISVARNIKEFQYDPKRSFKAWLLQATRWRINDQFRKRMPVERHPVRRAGETARTGTIEKVSSPGGYDLEAKWDSEWQQHMQEAALAKLKTKIRAKHYQIFDYYALRGWPIEKVTATLNVTPDSVYQVKKRVTELLKKEVTRLAEEIV